MIIRSPKAIRHRQVQAALLADDVALLEACLPKARTQERVQWLLLTLCSDTPSPRCQEAILRGLRATTLTSVIERNWQPPLRHLARLHPLIEAVKGYERVRMLRTLANHATCVQARFLVEHWGEEMAPKRQFKTWMDVKLFVMLNACVPHWTLPQLRLVARTADKMGKLNDIPAIIEESARKEAARIRRQIASAVPRAAGPPPKRVRL